MSCYLIIVYRKHYVFYRTLYNCTNRIHQALQHTYFISCFFNPNETFVWCIFRFIFKFVLPCLLFLNCSYLFCLTCKNNKKTMKEQRVNRQRKTKKIIFNSKKEFVRDHSFMTSTKKSKFRTPTHLFPSIHNHPILKFWSKQIPLLDVLNSHSKPAWFNFAQLFLC